MKKIKRSISILLIAMMALAMLGGCGNNSTSGNSTANGDSAKATEKTADAGEAKGTESNPFILGVSPMSGWYAWYGVKDTGIFEQNGVYVDLQFFPVYSDSLTAFYSGQVDGICIAASDAVAPVNEGVDFKVVLVNDNSYGADGIVVQDGINSIEDLKGKTVATEVGTLEHMFLLKILEENNIVLDENQKTIPEANEEVTAGAVIKIVDKSYNEVQIAKVSEEGVQTTLEDLLNNYAPITEKVVTEQVEIPYELSLIHI